MSKHFESILIRDNHMIMMFRSVILTIACLSLWNCGATTQDDSSELMHDAKAQTTAKIDSSSIWDMDWPEVKLTQIDETQDCPRLLNFFKLGIPKLNHCSSIILDDQLELDYHQNQILSDGRLTVIHKSSNIGEAISLEEKVNISTINRNGHRSIFFTSRSKDKIKGASIRPDGYAQIIGAAPVEIKAGKAYAREQADTILGIKIPLNSLISYPLPKGGGEVDPDLLSVISTENSLDTSYIFPSSKGGFTVLADETFLGNIWSDFRVAIIGKNGKFEGELNEPSKNLASARIAKKLKNGDILVMAFNRASHGAQKVILTRLNPDGEMIWEKITKFNFLAPFNFTETSNEEIWVTGNIDKGNWDENIQHLMLNKYSSNGELLSDKVFENEALQYGTAILPLPNGETLISVGEGDVMFDGISETELYHINAEGKIVQRSGLYEDTIHLPMTFKEFYTHPDGRIFIFYNSGHIAILK